MKTSLARILIDALMLIAVLVLPWYISVVLLAAAIIYFSFYIEGICLAFLFDTLYGSGGVPKVLIMATAFLMVVMFVKTRVR